MKKQDRFFTLLKRGEVKPDDMSKYVGEWHDGGGFGIDLHEYLGMTFKQYKSFVENRFENLDRFYGIERNKKVASKKDRQ